jgi:hypothetical protein
MPHAWLSSLRRATVRKAHYQASVFRPEIIFLLQLLQHVIEHPLAFDHNRGARARNDMWFPVVVEPLISESRDTPNPYIVTHIMSSKLGVDHGLELGSSLQSLCHFSPLSGAADLDSLSRVRA